ncbi:MAG: citryl-CoA lyase [Candidatus Magasanikbacteria bacterium]
MKFQTKLTKVEKGEEIIRGEKLEKLMTENTFAQNIFFLLTGKIPDKKQTKMFEAILSSVIDHGPATASALTARISASAKNPLHASVAAGLLGLGERHGVVISQAMEFFYNHEDEKDWLTLLKQMKENKQYVLGYGHKFFEDADPRTVKLFEIAKQNDIFGQHCELALVVEKNLNEISSKKLPLNADGAIAAILCDMGMASNIGNGIFIIARVPGLVAQVLEEVENDTGIKRLSDEEIEYL